VGGCSYDYLSLGNTLRLQTARSMLMTYYMSWDLTSVLSHMQQRLLSVNFIFIGTYRSVARTYCVQADTKDKAQRTTRCYYRIRGM